MQIKNYPLRYDRLDGPGSADAITPSPRHGVELSWQPIFGISSRMPLFIGWLEAGRDPAQPSDSHTGVDHARNVYTLIRRAGGYLQDLYDADRHPRNLGAPLSAPSNQGG